jgi:hypothetical protein
MAEITDLFNALEKSLKKTHNSSDTVKSPHSQIVQEPQANLPIVPKDSISLRGP